jgi:hypothetical protein
MPNSAPIQPRLAIHRAALLTGVLLFGAVCWFAVRQRGGGPQPGTTAESMRMLRFFVPFLCAVAISVAIAIRVVVARTAQQTLRLVAWAAGDAPALAGGVYYLTVGDPRYYVVGVTAMLATFIIVPMRDA